MDSINDYKFISKEFQNIYYRIYCFILLTELKYYKLRYNFIDDTNEYYIHDSCLENSYLDLLD